MKNNAIAIANYLIEHSKEITGNQLTILSLIKQVYFVHGFSLAILDKPAIDERFDRVEAWKYGPVIPSVYHTFKFNGYDEITKPGVILDMGVNKVETPILKDEKLKKLCEIVLKRYKNFSPNELVNLTHKPGTPWSLSYVKDKNSLINDDLTKIYYQSIVNSILDEKK